MKNGGFNALQTNLSTKMVGHFLWDFQGVLLIIQNHHMIEALVFSNDWEFGNIETCHPPRNTAHDKFFFTHPFFLPIRLELYLKMMSVFFYKTGSSPFFGVKG